MRQRMKKLRGKMRILASFSFFLFLALPPSASGAGAQPGASLSTGLFANAKEIFQPLLADPIEIQIALRLVTPVSRKLLGEIAVGDYLGLYRWKLPWGPEAYLQWSLAGGVLARFDLVAETKDSQVIDYHAAMPVDLRVGRWSTRALPYHISSHLGDDSIKRTGKLPEKYSLDAWKWLFAYEPSKHWRWYAGPFYVIRWTHVERGRYAWQSGLEWRSGWWAGGHAKTFWGNDFQAWQRAGWNPMFNSQLGVKIVHDQQDPHGLSIFAEFGAGRRSHGQFYQDQETHWNLGLRFEIP